MNRKDLLEAMGDQPSPRQEFLLRVAQWLRESDPEGCDPGWSYFPQAKAFTELLESAGYAVVPVEPTEAMIDAMFMAYNSMDNIHLSDWDKSREMYKAILKEAQGQ